MGCLRMRAGICSTGFVRLIVENHDLQVRHRWQNPNNHGTSRPSFSYLE